MSGANQMMLGVARIARCVLQGCASFLRRLASRVKVRLTKYDVAPRAGTRCLERKLLEKFETMLSSRKKGTSTN